MSDLLQFVRDNIQTVENFQQLYERFVQVVGARCSMDHLPPYVSSPVDIFNMLKTIFK